MANTYIDHTASPAQTDFAFSFDYLEDEHVEVFIDGTKKTLTTDYTIVTSPSTKIVLTVAATGGESVRVRRNSDPSTDLVDFVNGSVLTETELDRAYQHNRYLNEEAFEGNQSSLQTVEGGTDFDANFNKIVNLGTPTNSTDAAHKNYIDNLLALDGTSLSGFNKSVHTGDNTTTQFTLSFTAQTATAAAFRVTVDGSVQTPDTDYTVETGTNQITFTSAPANSTNIVVVPLGTAQDVNSVEVTATGTAINKTLADWTADIETNAASFSDVSSSNVTATGSTTARSLADRFAETFNVKDYGATGDGVTDDRTAINLAFTAMANAGGGTIFFPKGTYNISDYIGNTTSPTAQISVSVVGEKGTVINCDPTASANHALYLNYADLEHCFVSGLKVNGNNKTRRGIHISATSGSFREVVVENCDVENIKIINTVTGSGNGISISSSGFSFRAAVRNCSVNGVTRDWWNGGEYLAGIIITDTEICEVDNCNVKNVDWNSYQAQDADCIQIFSEQDGTGDYRKSVASVTNCIIENGYGRLLKLQTEGNALVENNMFILDGSSELIAGWKGVDSQVADANIRNNRFFIGDSWTGGSSANLIALQSPTATNINYTYETFTQKFCNNIVEVKGTMPYGVIPGVPNTSSASKQYVEICDNVISYTGQSLDSSSSSTAFTQFVYTSAWNDPASVTGQYYWKINNNKVHTYYFIRFSGTQRNYTDKLWIEVVGNDRFPLASGGGSIFYQGATVGAYTSNIKIGDNQFGDDEGGVFTWPSDPTKWSNGCDFPEGDSTAGAISNMPANYRNGRIYKRGGVLGVETVSGSTVYKYISTDNGTTWYQV